MPLVAASLQPPQLILIRPQHRRIGLRTAQPIGNDVVVLPTNPIARQHPPLVLGDRQGIERGVVAGRYTLSGHNLIFIERLESQRKQGVEFLLIFDMSIRQAI